MRKYSMFIYAIMQRQLGQLNIYFYTWQKVDENSHSFYVGFKFQ